MKLSDHIKARQEEAAKEDQKERQRRVQLAEYAESKHCYNTDDIEIDVDEPPEISETDDGYWCKAWVWVSWDEFEGED